MTSDGDPRRRTVYLADGWSARAGASTLRALLEASGFAVVEQGWGHDLGPFLNYIDAFACVVRVDERGQASNRAMFTAGYVYGGGLRLVLVRRDQDAGVTPMRTFDRVCCDHELPAVLRELSEDGRTPVAWDPQPEASR